MGQVAAAETGRAAGITTVHLFGFLQEYVQVTDVGFYEQILVEAEDLEQEADCVGVLVEICLVESVNQFVETMEVDLTRPARDLGNFRQSEPLLDLVDAFDRCVVF
jgi:hypothetical protein